MGAIPAALAGQYQPFPVEVDLAERSARGDMWSVRADGDRIFCETDNAELLDALDMVDNFSYLSFGWDANDRCTNIQVSTQSFYLPEFKTR